MNNNLKNILEKIYKGDLNVNGQEPFIGIVLKGLLYNLNKEIKIRNIPVPHFILHTGDDRLWLETKGYNASIEPLTISNENSVYSIIPKCIVTPGSIDLDVAQLSAPYSQGMFQYECNDGENDGIYTLAGEFRRIPLKINVDLKYYTDSYSDMLELIQYIISCLAFIRTFDVMYMGQKIKCSYKIPDSFSEEHTMEIDGALSDNREHNLNLSIELETNMPVFNNKTIIEPIAIVNTGNPSSVEHKLSTINNSNSFDSIDSISSINNTNQNDEQILTLKIRSIL